jgi:hypothetical protein
LNHDWLIVTTKGLEQLETIIESRHANLFRNKKVPRESLPFDSVLGPQLRLTARKRDKFDDDIIKSILEREETDEDGKPMQIFTESLKGYVEDLKTLQGKGQ